MNSSMNQKMHQQSEPLTNSDFHSFMEKENLQTNLEVASEFGVSIRDVKILKHKLSRN